MTPGPVCLPVLFLEPCKISIFAVAVSEPNAVSAIFMAIPLVVIVMPPVMVNPVIVVPAIGRSVILRLQGHRDRRS